MPELQTIFKHVHLKSMSPTQAKAFNLIRLCRTAKLGSHSDVCTECGTVDISYNSCRNRHCPKCQHSTQQKWVEAQMSNLLPVGYFHVVFTIPQELNTLVFQNQKFLYSLLIQSAGHTLTELAKDPKHLGATIGVTSVLHTWWQNLCFHPHVHCIVPSGGLSNDGLRFVRTRKKFFLPVKVISKKFRGKFLDLLKQSYEVGKLEFFNDAKKLAFKYNFQELIDSLYALKWVVFCRKPFKSPGHVVRYLGRYTHRVAISNSRIQSFNGQTVRFSWKDYKDQGKSKVMTLSAAEFTRRFLLHVLPDKFIKIRHYGLLCRNIRTKLAKCMKLSGSCPLISTIKKYIKTCRTCGSSEVIPFVIRQYSLASP